MISMRPFSLALLTYAALFAFGACGDDMESNPSGAANGEACGEGSDCRSTLCFIAVSGDPGECRAVPASCNDDPSCTESDCLDEVKADCTGNSTSCVGIAGSHTIECGPPAAGGAGGL
jgi:hypothetical protein